MYRVLRVLVALQAVGLVVAQTIAVLAPADERVEPGEVVVLAYEITATADVAVAVEASSGSGWVTRVVPTDALLQADVAQTIEVTVTVPDDAAAFSYDEVTLRVLGVEPAVERTIVLSVLEVFEVLIEAPAQAPVGSEGFRVVAINAGNGDDTVVLELWRDGAVLARRDVRLARGDRTEVRFDLPEEGSFELRATNDRGLDVRRTVRALRFGAPPPAPLELRGRATVAFDLADGWATEVALRGPLSDYTRLDLLVDPVTWRRSFLEVAHERAAARVGAASAPFGLDLPTDFVAAASYTPDAFGVAASVGVTPSDRLAAVVATSWTSSDFSVALGGGVRDGAAVAALRTRYADATTTVDANGRYRDGALTARLTAEVRGPDRSSTLVRLDAQGWLTNNARLGVEARYRTGTTTAYANVTAPFRTGATWTWRAGLLGTWDAEAPGTPQVALQAGSSESFGRVTWRGDVPGGGRTVHTVGVRYDTIGVGLTLDTAWTWRGATAFGFDARLQYYPAVQRVDGRVRATLDVASDAADFKLEGDWNLTNDSVGLEATVGLGTQPWLVDVDGSVRYRYARPSAPWTYAVGVALTYAFDVGVPAALVDATGGRRFGTLTGRVVADGAPVAGVVVEVGRFRVLTDDAGAFALDVPPATYRVGVDRSSLPSGYRVAEPTPLTVVLGPRGREELTLVLARSD